MIVLSNMSKCFTENNYINVRHQFSLVPIKLGNSVIPHKAPTYWTNLKNNAQNWPGIRHIDVVMCRIFYINVINTRTEKILTQVLNFSYNRPMIRLLSVCSVIDFTLMFLLIDIACMVLVIDFSAPLSNVKCRWSCMCDNVSYFTLTTICPLRYLFLITECTT